jgi:hypothetical protein
MRSSAVLTAASLCLLSVCWSRGNLAAAPPVVASVARAPTAANASYPSPEKLRAAFHKLLDRPKVDPDVKQLSRPRTEGGLTTEHLSFASERKAG